MKNEQQKKIYWMFASLLKMIEDLREKKKPPKHKQLIARSGLLFTILIYLCTLSGH